MQFPFPISPEMMNMASQMMNNMSDDQLQATMSKAGFGGIDPSFIRQAGKMASGFNQNNQTPPNNPATSVPQNNKEVDSSNKKENDKKEEESYTQVQRFKYINDIQDDAKSLFDNEKFKEAGIRYLEAVQEVEEKKEMEPSLRENAELNQIEISCRLQFVQSKMNCG